MPWTRGIAALFADPPRHEFALDDVKILAHRRIRSNWTVGGLHGLSSPGLPGSDLRGDATGRRAWEARKYEGGGGRA